MVIFISIRLTLLFLVRRQPEFGLQGSAYWELLERKVRRDFKEFRVFKALPVL
jgi:hypothetical protein